MAFIVHVHEGCMYQNAPLQTYYLLYYPEIHPHLKHVK